MLHACGFRFRLHRKTLPWKPDIVLPKLNTVIFVHGCFWHRHEGCRYAYTPKSRVEFWTRKLERNRQRDVENVSALHALGWRTLVVWKCETKDSLALIAQLHELLANTLVTDKNEMKNGVHS